jgi:hypothetical protein
MSFSTTMAIPSYLVQIVTAAEDKALAFITATGSIFPFSTGWQTVVTAV